MPEIKNCMSFAVDQQWERFRQADCIGPKANETSRWRAGRNQGQNQGERRETRVDYWV